MKARVRQKKGEHLNPGFNTLRMRQGVREIDHHKEEILAVEGLFPEVKAEEGMFGALHVVNRDMCNGIVLIIDQQSSIV